MLIYHLMFVDLEQEQITAKIADSKCMHVVRGMCTGYCWQRIQHAIGLSASLCICQITVRGNKLHGGMSVRVAGLY